MQVAETEPANKIAQADPTAQNEKIVIVRILRGFALFGVLQGNFNAMVNNNVPGSIIESISTSFDFTLDRLHAVFIQNIFMTLFSILFGYGFGVIMERMAKKNLNTTHSFIRMFWLFLFGCIQFALWDEDILHFYATVIICGIIFYGFGFGLYNRPERYELYYVVAAVWIFQIIYSHILFRYFRFGPFKWAWRSLTYWKWQPLKRLTMI
jgi:uncharacterized membrane protein YeiB